MLEGSNTAYFVKYKNWIMFLSRSYQPSQNKKTKIDLRILTWWIMESVMKFPSVLSCAILASRVVSTEPMSILGSISISCCQGFKLFNTSWSKIHIGKFLGSLFKIYTFFRMLKFYLKQRNHKIFWLKHAHFILC